MNQDPCLSCYTDAQPAAAPLANHPILRLVSFVTELQQPTEPVSSQPENQADPGKKKKKKENLMNLNSEKGVIRVWYDTRFVI